LGCIDLTEGTIEPIDEILLSGSTAVTVAVTYEVMVDCTVQRGLIIDGDIKTGLALGAVDQSCNTVTSRRNGTGSDVPHIVLSLHCHCVNAVGGKIQARTLRRLLET
jgi:hypothetical protein